MFGFRAAREDPSQIHRSRGRDIRYLYDTRMLVYDANVAEASAERAQETRSPARRAAPPTTFARATGSRLALRPVERQRPLNDRVARKSIGVPLTLQVILLPTGRRRGSSTTALGFAALNVRTALCRSSTRAQNLGDDVRFRDSH